MTATSACSVVSDGRTSPIWRKRVTTLFLMWHQGAKRLVMTPQTSSDSHAPGSGQDCRLALVLTVWRSTNARTQSCKTAALHEKKLARAQEVQSQMSSQFCPQARALVVRLGKPARKMINSFWAIVRRCSWELPPAAGPQERLRQTAPADAMVRRQRSNKNQHMKSCKINNGFFSGGALVKITVWKLAKSTLHLSRDARQKIIL